MRAVYLSILAVFIYLLVGLLLFLNQDKMLYFPVAKSEHPYAIALFKHESVSIEVIHLNKGKEKALLYFGGNAESVVASAHDFTKYFPNHSVYLMNYRGYAGSNSTPSEQGFYEDALFIFDSIKPRHVNISVVGRSLGTGVATFLASQRDFTSLVLVSPYDSVQSVAQSLYPIYPMSLLLRDKYNAISHIKAIKEPTLIMISEFDKTIPFKHSKRMMDAFPASQVTIKMIKGTDHNSIIGQERYYQALHKFITNIK